VVYIHMDLLAQRNLAEVESETKNKERENVSSG